jgi:hypothetical protein
LILLSLHNGDLIKGFIKSLCFYSHEAVKRAVLKASSHNTYVETISQSADTLHKGLIEWEPDLIEQVFAQNCAKRLRTMHLGICDVLIDITEEDFYGKVDGLWLHPWTGEAGVKAHYKFIVCTAKIRNKKFPVAVKILRIGSDIASAIGFLLQACKKAGLLIRTVLLDRGFYSADIIRELKEQEVFYLVFARKSKNINCMLESMQKSAVIIHEMTLNKNKTKTKIETNLALVKNYNDFDWVFATNLEMSEKEIAKRYTIRWNIETDFRVQDEARIKSKSKRPEVRLFYFLISCLLLFVWNATQKNHVTFKKFIINLSESQFIEHKILFV